MLLHKNIKVKVFSLDEDTYFFDIITGVLQGNALTLYLCKFSLDYVLRTSIDLMKENSFTLKKSKKQTIPTKNYHGRRLHR